MDKTTILCSSFKVHITVQKILNALHGIGNTPLYSSKWIITTGIIGNCYLEILITNLKEEMSTSMIRQAHNHVFHGV
jgi:hypothetical protein